MHYCKNVFFVLKLFLVLALTMGCGEESTGAIDAQLDQKSSDIGREDGPLATDQRLALDGAIFLDGRAQPDQARDQVIPDQGSTDALIYKDAQGVIKAMITDEIAHNPGSSCASPDLELQSLSTLIMIIPKNIPSSVVDGDCPYGHKAVVSLIGSQLKLTIEKDTTKICTPPPCWDFAVMVSGLATGPYQVKAFGLSGTISVP